MLIKGIPYFIKVILDPIKIRMEALLEDRLHRTVFYAAADPSDHKIDRLVGLPVTFALQPLEITLQLVDGINDGSGKIFIEHDLLHYVPCVEPAPVGLQV